MRVLKANPLRSYQESAQSHAEADIACGRKWVCQCGACRIARQEKFKPVIKEKPKEVENG